MAIFNNPLDSKSRDFLLIKRIKRLTFWFNLLIRFCFESINNQLYGIFHKISSYQLFINNVCHSLWLLHDLDIYLINTLVPRISHGRGFFEKSILSSFFDCICPLIYLNKVNKTQTLMQLKLGKDDRS